MTGHRIGENAVLDNCLITDGCNIKGTVRHSILFSGVTVEEGAIVEDAVVMGHSTIKAGRLSDTVSLQKMRPSKKMRLWEQNQKGKELEKLPQLQRM